MHRHRSLRSRLSPLVLLTAALAACGGSVADGGDDSFDADSGDDGSYGDDDGSDDGNPNGTGGNTSLCSVYDDQPSEGFVEIRISNATSRTLYLGQDIVNCQQLPFFDVVSPRGGELTTGGYDCFASCEEVRAGEFVGCPTICRYPSARSLEPGTATRILWDARFLVSQTVTASCTADGKEAASCEQWQAVEFGPLTFSAQGHAELDCTETLGDCETSCEEDEAAGGCDFAGALVKGDVVSAEAAVELDESFGLGEDAPDVDRKVVELVFNE